MKKATAIKATISAVAASALLSGTVAFALPALSSNDDTAVRDDTTLVTQTISDSIGNEPQTAAAPAVVPVADSAREAAPAAVAVETPIVEAAPVAVEAPAVEESSIIDEPTAVSTVEVHAPVVEAPVTPEVEKGRYHAVAYKDLGDNKMLAVYESDPVDSIGTAELVEIVALDSSNPFLGLSLVSFTESPDGTVSCTWESEEVSDDDWSLGTAELIMTVPSSEFFVMR